MSELYGLIIKDELRPNNNHPFWQCVVKTIDDVIKIIIFEMATIEKEQLPKKNDIIKINLNANGVKDQRDTKFKNMVLTKNSYIKVSSKDIDKQILAKIYDAPSVSPEALQEAYKSITDKSIYKDTNNFLLVMACFASLPKNKLITCPAACSVHHALSGGLLEHTSQVLRISQGIVANFPYPKLINPDLIYAGASLHDIGKVLTYDVDELGQPTVSSTEQSIGHAYYSMSLVEKIGKEQKIPINFLNELLHIIASHHSRIEFGAIKVPMSMEAMIVGQADVLSAKSNMIYEKIQNMKSKSQTLENEYKWCHETYITTDGMRKCLNG